LRIISTVYDDIYVVDDDDDNHDDYDDHDDDEDGDDHGS
jgi:hypothetical protein